MEDLAVQHAPQAAVDPKSPEAPVLAEIIAHPEPAHRDAPLVDQAPQAERKKRATKVEALQGKIAMAHLQLHSMERKHVESITGLSQGTVSTLLKRQQVAELAATVRRCSAKRRISPSSRGSSHWLLRQPPRRQQRRR